MHWFYFVCTVLVVWRLTHLLSKEDGPFDVIFVLRRKAGNGFWGSLLDCFYCLSIWVALPFGIGLGGSWLEKIMFWLALSGGACLLEQGTAGRSASNSGTYRED